MRKTTLILTAIFLLITVSAVGQKTKKVKKEYKNPWYSEVYYVLKKDRQIKHGNYQKRGFMDHLMINGYYKNNLKDSVWTEYFWRTEIIQSQGNYLNDKKTGTWEEYQLCDNKSVLKSKGAFVEGERTGIWEFYNKKAELINKYDFDNRKLVYFKPDDTEYEIYTDSGFVKMKLDCPPLLLCGASEVTKVIGKMNYPPLAQESGIDGKVSISLLVDTTGVAYDHKIDKGIGYGCDEEALKVVKQLPNDWLPAYMNGQPVVAKYIFPIRFQLN